MEVRGVVLMIVYVFTAFVSLCNSFHIEKVCKKVFDLNFRLTEYRCAYAGKGIYTFSSSTPVERITFDRLLTVRVLQGSVLRKGV